MESTGEYIGLVVRLQADADGAWVLAVDGTHGPLSLPLVPATLIVRLWRAEETGLLRGSVSLAGSDQWAPLHTNTTLIELVQAWLFNSGHTTKAT